MAFIMEECFGEMQGYSWEECKDTLGGHKDAVGLRAEDEECRDVLGRCNDALG